MKDSLCEWILLVDFSAIFNKAYNFYDFLLAFLYTNTRVKRSISRINNFCNKIILESVKYTIFEIQKMSVTDYYRFFQSSAVP